ncbi:hypothetical protein ACTXJX_11730 [Glutamicibacter ardleyensis]|uniref:hypothetical protein n=1 Tax=Glutamicibacter ardleyensis TaxID=225894 RepID=UPI003FD64B00
MDRFTDLDVVEVQFTPAGKPWKVLRDGRTWAVAVEPTVFFERIKWWELGIRIPKGAGVKIDYAVWLVQVRLGNNERSSLLSWELVEDTFGKVWRVHDLPIEGQ